MKNRLAAFFAKKGGAGFGILSWLSCPLVIWLSYAPWIAGTLNTVDYLLICMLPLFCAKLANSIFVDLTSYKNLMISKNKIGGVMNEPEETGRDRKSTRLNSSHNNQSRMPSSA